MTVAKGQIFHSQNGEQKIWPQPGKKFWGTRGHLGLI